MQQWQEPLFAWNQPSSFHQPSIVHPSQPNLHQHYSYDNTQQPLDPAQSWQLNLQYWQHPSPDQPVSASSVHPSQLSAPCHLASSSSVPVPPPAEASDAYDRESDDQPSDGEHDSSANPQHIELEKPRPKLTRSSRACTVCRRLKLRCVGAEDGGPCRKCTISNQKCIFPESKRGKSTKTSQQELATTVRKMEQTLATVIRSLKNPNLSSLVSGMASCPPSPGSATKVDWQLTPDSGSSESSESVSQSMELTSPTLPYLPGDTLNPLGLLAETSLGVHNKRPHSPSPNMLARLEGKDPVEEQKVGIANERYFKPGAMTLLPIRRLFIERQVQPEMLSFVSTPEVLELFEIFFKHVNPHCSLLVPNMHTPSYVCSRSPFLLTAICSIASRFSGKLNIHHKRLCKLAKKLAFDVPNKGYKSIEIVQAYLILTLWGYGPACNYEHDTTWLLLGLAIRMATDLNLHRPVTQVSNVTAEGLQHAVEIRNRERTWILCFILDRSVSAQFGKPHTIHEDYIIRNVTQWWHHPLAVILDSGLAVYAELQRILTRSLELMYSDTASSSGLQSQCNYLVAVKTAESQIMTLAEEWRHYLDNYHASDEDSQQLNYWKASAKFYYFYALLLLNSFGLQDAIERTPINLSHFFSRVYDVGVHCARVVIEEMSQGGFFRYSPNSHYIQCSYAVLTLLKLTRHEFQVIHDCREELLRLTREVAQTIEKLATDAFHPAAMYSKFLKTAISSEMEGSDFEPSTPSDGIVSPGMMKSVQPKVQLSHTVDVVENSEPSSHLPSDTPNLQPEDHLPSPHPSLSLT